jgi:thiol-disulfide isomerase/thioredoxin
MSRTDSIHGALAALDDAPVWLNAEPLTADGLRGRVVLVDVWTYSCVNWLRTLPYVRAWADRYRDRGVVVIGVHGPEFAFERDLDNVRHATQELGVDYPVVIDNDFAIWQSLANRYWPAVYLVDRDGRIGYHHRRALGRGASLDVLRVEASGRSPRFGDAAPARAPPAADAQPAAEDDRGADRVVLAGASRAGPEAGRVGTAAREVRPGSWSPRTASGRCSVVTG